MHEQDIHGVAVPIGRKKAPRVLGDCIPGDVVELPTGETVRVCNPNIAGAVFVRRLGGGAEGELEPRERDTLVVPVELR